MIKERILNGLLVAMVSLSLLLSSRLWFGSSLFAPFLSSETPRVDAPPPAPPVVASPIPDVTTPSSVVLVDGDRALALKPNELGYDALWQKIMGILTPLGTGQPYLQPVDDASLRPLFEKGPALVVDFPVSMTLQQWRWAWNWRDKPSDVEKPIDRLMFFLNDPARIVFYGRFDALELFLTAEDRKTLLHAYEATRALYGDDFTGRLLGPEAGDMRLDLGVIGPAATLEVQQPLLRPVRISEPDFAARFFPDMSVVRQIIDSDTFMTYTDGVRMLRMYSYGELEYWSGDVPQEADTPTFGQGLQIASEFVSTHGGFPEDLQLTEVMVVEGRLRLTYGRKATHEPLVGWSKPLVQVEVAGGKVVRYARLPDYFVESRSASQPVITPEIALEAAAREGQGARWEQVHRIELAQVLTQGSDQISRPCWVIWLNFRPEPLYVDALSGRLLRR